MFIYLSVWRASFFASLVLGPFQLRLLSSMSHWAIQTIEERLTASSSILPIVKSDGLGSVFDYQTSGRYRIYFTLYRKLEKAGRMSAGKKLPGMRRDLSEPDLEEDAARFRHVSMPCRHCHRDGLSHCLRRFSIKVTTHQFMLLSKAEALGTQNIVKSGRRTVKRENCFACEPTAIQENQPFRH